MDQDSGGPLSKRFCLPDDGHSCDTCVWHYEDIWHSTECPRCCHAPEHVAAPRNTPAMDEDGKPCTCTEMGPRPFTTKALSEVPDGYAEAWGLKNVFNEIVRKWIDEWRPNAPAKRK